ncbi:MAG: hypothetical protein ACYS83_10315 [Planctomycetota bacterium]|jgi:hypothetical protein
MAQNNQTRSSSSSFKNFIHTTLTHRQLPLIIAILAIIFTLSSLNVGLLLDDHCHRIKLLGSTTFPDVGSPLDIFLFLSGDPEHTWQAMDIGVTPWWTYPEIKGAFWRPLSALTHLLDYKLWPDNPAIMHAQNILWYAVLVAAAAFLYRRFMGLTLAAALAALLYTIDDAHGVPVGFLANRNAILAALFGVLAIIAHDRWRRHGWRAGMALGPLLLALSLLSAEAGIATCGYLAAYVVFVDRGTLLQRFRSLIFYVIVVVLWRVVWAHLGYGMANIEPLYIDPLVDPLYYATAVLRRAPILLLGQWAFPPSDIAIMLKPEQVYILCFIALGFLLLLTIALFPLLRQERTARFWAMGMVLSVFPICATFPADRQLLFVGIGAMGLLGQFFAIFFDRSKGRPSFLLQHVAVVSLAIVFTLIHLIVAPLALPLRAAYPLGPKKLLDQFHVHIPMDTSIKGQDLIVVNPPITLLAMFSPFIWDATGQPLPRHTRILAPGWSPVSVHRPDAQTLIIRPKAGYLPSVMDKSLRSRHHPMNLGESVKLTGMTVQVTELADDGQPAEAAFTFTVPLEDSSLRWLQWKQGAFVPFAPPPIGQTIELQGVY